MAFISRLLAKAGFNSDGVGIIGNPRLDTYGETIVKPLGAKAHAYAEEGSLFINMNPTISTGVKFQGDTTTAWVATTPSLLIVNNDAAGGKNIILDTVKMLVTGAGAGLTSLHAAVILDIGNRWASSGTAITANTVNANMGSAAASIARLYYGATASAASASVRQVGRGVLRGAIPVVNDMYLLSFGGDGAIAGAGTDGTTTIMAKGFHFPAVVIGPQQSLLIYLWAGSMSTSPTMEYEIVWIER